MFCEMNLKSIFNSSVSPQKLCQCPSCQFTFDFFNSKIKYWTDYMGCVLCFRGPTQGRFETEHEQFVLLLPILALVSGQVVIA